MLHVRQKKRWRCTRDNSSGGVACVGRDALSVKETLHIHILQKKTSQYPARCHGEVLQSRLDKEKVRKIPFMWLTWVVIWEE